MLSERSEGSKAYREASPLPQILRCPQDDMQFARKVRHNWKNLYISYLRSHFEDDSSEEGMEFGYSHPNWFQSLVFFHRLK